MPWCLSEADGKVEVGVGGGHAESGGGEAWAGRGA